MSPQVQRVCPLVSSGKSQVRDYCPLSMAMKWVRLSDLAGAMASKCQKQGLNLDMGDPKFLFFPPAGAQPPVTEPDAEAECRLASQALTP